MRKLVIVLAAGAGALAMAGAANAGIIYKIDITTHYQFGGCGDSGSPCANPDTGFVTFTNNGPGPFAGSFGITAVAGDTTDWSQANGGGLAAGASYTFAVADESSNRGGFNGPTGTVQPGVTMFLNGNFGSHAVTLSVNDADVHSGVPRTNPFGDTLDSYVLQGGDDLGRDTGDAFETSQADGHFEFIARGVPEPATWGMMLLGLGGLGAAMRMRRRSATVTA
jgi:hypothetical protein